jgi:hypothetical protein
VKHVVDHPAPLALEPHQQMQSGGRTGHFGSIAELLADGVDERISSCGVGDVGPSQVTIEVSLGDKISEP